MYMSGKDTLSIHTCRSTHVLKTDCRVYIYFNYMADSKHVNVHVVPVDCLCCMCHEYPSFKSSLKMTKEQQKEQNQ